MLSRYGGRETPAGDMQPGIDELYRSAIDLQSERKLREAERLHRLILSREPNLPGAARRLPLTSTREPNPPGALHYLGVIAMETGHLEDAEGLMRRSLRLHP